MYVLTDKSKTLLGQYEALADSSDVQKAKKGVIWKIWVALLGGEQELERRINILETIESTGEPPEGTSASDIAKLLKNNGIEKVSEE